MQNFRIMNPTCEEAPFASSRGEAHHWRTLLAEGRCRYKDLPATGANPFDPASAHELHRLPLYRFNLRRPRNRWVQRRQHATSADRKPQQIRIQNLRRLPVEVAKSACRGDPSRPPLRGLPGPPQRVSVGSLPPETPSHGRGDRNYQKESLRLRLHRFNP